MERTPRFAQAPARSGVAVAWLFASGARNEDTEQSDLDVAVLARSGRQPLDLLEISELTGTLEALLGESVDVVAFERAPLQLRARIVLEGQVLYSQDEPLRVRTVVDTQSRWEDLRPALAEMDRAYLAAVARRGLGG